MIRQWWEGHPGVRVEGLRQVLKNRDVFPLRNGTGRASSGRLWMGTMTFGTEVEIGKGWMRVAVGHEQSPACFRGPGWWLCATVGQGHALVSRLVQRPSRCCHSLLCADRGLRQGGGVDAVGELQIQSPPFLSACLLGIVPMAHWPRLAGDTGSKK